MSPNVNYLSVVVVLLLSRGNIQISWQTIRKLKLYQNWTSYAIRKELWVKLMLDKQNLNLKIMIALVSNNNQTNDLSGCSPK